MKYLLSDGRVLTAGTPFIFGETQFPANWLALATPDELAELSIVAVAPPPMPADFDPKRYKWVETADPPYGAWVPWTDAELAALRKVEIDSITERIKAERDRRRYEGGVKVGSHWFKSGRDQAIEYSNLAAMAQFAGLPDSAVLRQGWRTMADGVTVDMTPLLAKQIVLAGGANWMAVDDAAKAHIAAASAAASPASYDFSGGWPEVYVPPTQNVVPHG